MTTLPPLYPKHSQDLKWFLAKDNSPFSSSSTKFLPRYKFSDNHIKPEDNQGIRLSKKRQDGMNAYQFETKIHSQKEFQINPKVLL